MKTAFLCVDFVVTSLLATVIALRYWRLIRKGLLIEGHFFLMLGVQATVLALTALAVRTAIRLAAGDNGPIGEGHAFSLGSRAGLLLVFVTLPLMASAKDDAADKKKAETKEDRIHDTPPEGTVFKDANPVPWMAGT